MAFGKLETADFDSFYNLDDFAVEVSFAGEPQPGQFRNEEIADEDRYGVFPTFRTNVRFDEGSILTVGTQDYEVEAVNDLDSSEYRHILSKA